MPLVSDIERFVNAVIDTKDLFLVEVIVSNKSPLRIQVLVDSDVGLDIAKCAAISRQLATLLDSEQVIRDPYNLEVSSPGLGQPLKYRRQYLKNIGRRIQVTLVGEDHKQGELLEVGESSIVVNEEVAPAIRNPGSNRRMGSQEVVIPFDQIGQAKVLVSFKK